MTKKIILCADDFGEAPHISQAILMLAQEKRISATSCMTIGKDWYPHGLALKDIKNQLDIGLHFTLTQGEASPIKWLLRSFTGQIDTFFVEKQLNLQLDRFVEVMGCLPDFIDGHQHIHSFPGIRKALLNVIHQRFPRKKPYVRSLSPLLSGMDAKLKAFIVTCAAFGFSRALKKNHIKHNSSFGGLYSLTSNGQYRQYMIKWLKQAGPQTLLMCHPGKQLLKESEDPIGAARVLEYTYLLSPVFQKDLSEAGVRLGRLSV